MAVAGHKTVNYPTGKFLEGNYRPIQEERSVAFEDMTVIGEVPMDLSGAYIRNGPDNRHQPRGKYHRYDGDGMLHGVFFADGQASYRNSWIHTRCFDEEAAAGEALWGGMLDPRRPDRPDMPLKDTSNTDVVLHAGRFVTMWYQAGEPYLVDPKTLSTIGRYDLNDQRSRRISAHAKTDEETDEFVFFDYGRDHPFMSYGVVDKNGKQITDVSIELPGPRLPHDMWMSKNHSVLHDLPLIWDEDAYKHGRVKLRFEQNWPTRFGVIPRHGTDRDVRWYEFEPCFILHTINAWEEGDWLHLIGCRIYPFKDAAGNIDYSSIAVIMGRHKLNARLYRWSINLVNGDTAEGFIDKKWNAEFPTWNNGMMGSEMKYAYFAEVVTDPLLCFTGLIKYNTQTGASERFSDGDGYTYSEAPFAPALKATSEDHGYVVSFVRNGNAQQSEVHIFDAQNFSDGPICKLILPCRVPEGFHATWAPGHLMS